MKKALLLLVLLIGAASVFALPLNVGQSQFNIGTGFSTWGMPIYMGVDYGVTPDITLGGEATLRFHNHGSWVGIYGNGNYHFVNLLNMPSNTDFYAGLCLGFDVWLPDDGHENAHNSGLGLGVQVGGRYYFNDRLGLNLEFGGGFVSGGKIGISCKL
ncbi:MAG TPA: hypothetical protein PLI58_04640 [Candidatus Syntrophosphaera sp.]|nr:hypothetical protein [Candidatus Cloacimonadota bacterium]HOR03112.1 hypothetical protein [Candidatus Syntrophosphaera sp.]HOU71894.1 hypothetical protein [Candidatus Syntrophosphaera sp.]HPK82943.1 hypothetical protein [Candidatus Syntrophosphaera sp.]HQG94169.1 hypothetical protein [Candidatus Syntrophosphaera sp.]